MAQKSSYQTSTSRGAVPLSAKANAAVEQHSLDDLNDEAKRGQDVKEARGLKRDAGRSPHEAGTDQRVEDAKKTHHGSQ